jgi:hypothetical protein
VWQSFFKLQSVDLALLVFKVIRVELRRRLRDACKVIFAGCPWGIARHAIEQEHHIDNIGCDFSANHRWQRRRRPRKIIAPNQQAGGT